MAKKAATAAATVTDADIKEPQSLGALLQIDPNTVLADDNTRFNLKESRIQTLAESILSQGGVIEPVEVEPITEDGGPFKYRLTLGYYRHAAVKHLNTTMAAGLLLPAILHTNATPLDRLKRQLAENIERENQSPMDQAIAIKRLMDAGIPRIEIRQMFSRPGGRKGAKVQPASNSFLNIMLSFLSLPKSIQEKIHLGLLGVGAAYQLTKVDKDKQTAILSKAEEERQKELEREEKEEERFLTTEKKSQEQQEKAMAARDALVATEAKHLQAAEELEKQTNLTAELFKVSKGKHATPKDKKAANSAFIEAEKKQKLADEAATKAQKEHEQATVAYTKLTAPVEKKAPVKAKKALATEAGIVKATAEAASGSVPLNKNEMMKVIVDMCLPTGDAKDAKLIAIGSALKSCFLGITTDVQLYKEIRKIAG